MGEKIVNVNVRFPEPVRDRVKALAVRDRRSMNAEIVQLLEEAMDAREARTERPSPFAYPDPSEHRATGRLLRAAEDRPPPTTP